MLRQSEPGIQCPLSSELGGQLEGPVMADSVEKLEIPATTNFALM